MDPGFFAYPDPVFKSPDLDQPIYWRIWLKLSGIARNGQSRILLFYFFDKKNFFSVI